ncbi:nitroreductase [Krasilnikovia sp. MM14-A1004]|uniref:nitroreductase family protein n=1 Tax=Krasilnikovia sp. MM14-A1004 TaxID=3373541 RepID=UPI00399D42F5
MDVLTAVVTRRSRHALHEPAPSDAEFTELLKGAAAAPDHGKMRPWRWILVRGHERDTLGRHLAIGEPPEEQARTVQRMLRAPLVAALVFCPTENHKVPEWEQLAAASSVAYGLMLLLHSRGYGSIWRTGRLCTSRSAHELLGLTPAERLLGSLDIGTPDDLEPVNSRPVGNVTERVATFASLPRTGRADAGRTS